MKRIALLCCLLLLFSCKKDESLYTCKGIPDVNQSFSYLYFKTPKEGYLFGTLTQYEELDKNALARSNPIAKSVDEANIYKTVDGGRNWKKIEASANYSYSDIATVTGDDIYILRSDVRKNFELTIEHFSMSGQKVHTVMQTRPVSAIWHNGQTIFFANSRGAKRLYSFGVDRKVDSVSIKGYALQGLHSNGKPYAILSSQDESYFTNFDNGCRPAEMPISPDELTKLGNDRILIGGNPRNDTNRISLVVYDENTQRTKVIKEFQKYSIIKDLQSNGKAIVAFLGNIKGMFVEYDVAYSLDQGQSWHIKKLSESSYVHPSCLVDNIVYIYSGGARMQKVVLD